MRSASARADEFAITAAVTRSGACVASQRPIMPPSDTPAIAKRSIVERVGEREHIRAELVDADNRRADAGRTVAAGVVAQDAEVLRQHLGLRIEHAVVLTERVGQDHDRAIVGTRETVELA